MLDQEPDGNIFSIIAACQRATRRASNPQLHEEFVKEIDAAMNDGETDYNGMLDICEKYVNHDFDYFRE